jgi:hypothetical protein
MSNLKSYNYKAWQQAQTELNADGNDERGRYGEDESSVAPLHHKSRKITDEQWAEILKALHGNNS